MEGVRLLVRSRAGDPSATFREIAFTNPTIPTMKKKNEIIPIHLEPSEAADMKTTSEIAIVPRLCCKVSGSLGFLAIAGLQP